MRVALVHYWLVNWRGGEQVLRALADIYPEADIFTHVYDKQLVAERFSSHKVMTSFIAGLPASRKHYQKYLPLMPMALEQLDLRQYDLVISSESGPAKGVITHPYARHICYCHSPMRYVWDMYHEYMAPYGRLSRWMFAPVMHYMRNWDQLSAQRVDAFVANSRFVAQRIRKYYGRDAGVIYPPVAVDRFEASSERAGFFLWVGQLVRYKRPDILVDAFNRLGLPLVVIGEGEMLSELKARAAPNITFLGRQPFEVLRQHYATCRALVFPGVEDFGIVPVEAMASGAPVIALAAGGALETVVHGRTGLLYEDASASGLIDAINDFCKLDSLGDAADIRAHALSFSAERFKAEFNAFAKGQSEPA